MLTLFATIVIEAIVMLVIFRTNKRKKTRIKLNITEQMTALPKSSFWPPEIDKHKDKMPMFKIIGFCFVANLASYTITFLTPILFII